MGGEEAGYYTKCKEKALKLFSRGMVSPACPKEVTLEDKTPLRLKCGEWVAGNSEGK